jgi:predicted membrane protein
MTSSFCVVWAISDTESTQELYFMREAVRMIWGSNLCLVGITGGVVHGLGFESLSCRALASLLEGQMKHQHLPLKLL